MSYRVWSYHKACLSLVRHGWLVALLLGRRISPAKAISPRISRCALEPSGDISISWSRLHQLDFRFDARVEDNFTDCVFRAAARVPSRQPTEQCVPHRSDVGMEMSPPHCWHRLWANQSRPHLNIPTARPIVGKRGRLLPWCQTRQSKHVAVSRKNLKEKTIWWMSPKTSASFLVYLDSATSNRLRKLNIRSAL